MALNFSDLDAERDRLQNEHPGWRVWYVPGTGRDHLVRAAHPHAQRGKHR